MFIINLLLLSVFFVKVVSIKEHNICINCRYYINNDIDKFGKCLLFKVHEHEDLFEKRREMTDFLVTGREKKKINQAPRYVFCSTARDNEYMCGKEGKKYEDKRLQNYKKL